jgi:hypothetical protein
LLQCLDADFNIDFEDDNVVTEVSLLLQDVYRKCALGEEDKVKEIMDTLHSHAITRKTTVDRPGAAKDDDSDDDDDDEDGEFDEDDEEDDDDEDTAAAGAGRSEKKKEKAAPEVDADGWATIPTAAGKKKGGKGATSGSGEGSASSTSGSGEGSAASSSAAAGGLMDDDDEDKKETK